MVDPIDADHSSTVRFAVAPIEESPVNDPSRPLSAAPGLSGGDPVPTDRALAERLKMVATAVAHEAGAAALSYLRRAYLDGGGSLGSLRRSATTKSSSTDLVSGADRASEEIIVGRLGELRPEDGVVAEEGSARPSRSGIEWIIDPIDGTTNFLYGHGSFAISIAAVRDTVGLAGVVFDPLRAETFSAALGSGARLNDRELRAPESAAPLSEALVGTGFHYLASRRLAQAWLLPTILPNVRDIRRQGAAALDLCSVASGRLDAYYEAALQPWDLAAGLIVASEAGYAAETLDLGGELDATLVVAHPDLIGPISRLIEQAAARPRPA